MSDESHIPRLNREDLSEHEEKFRKWARSLDTTPERLKDLVMAGGEGARHVRELLGLSPNQPAGGEGGIRTHGTA